MTDDHLDINLVSEITVVMRDGKRVIYRGKGVEKLRRLIKNSPPLKSPSHKEKEPVVVEEYGSEDSGEISDERSDDSSVEERRPRKSKSGKKQPNGGYNTVSLDYKTAAPGTLSPHDLAKEMQRQAFASSGIKY